MRGIICSLAGVMAFSLLISCGGDDDGPTSPGQADVNSIVSDVGVQADGGVEAEDLGTPDMEPLGPRHLIILHTNDMHSQMFGTGPVSDYSPLTTGDDITTGGYARLATVLDELRAEAGDVPVLVLDGGDFAVGTSLVSLFSTQGAELRFMDAMGYHATTLGNHEFEFGPEALASMVERGLSGASQIQVVASNLVFDPAEPSDDTLEGLVQVGTIKTSTIIELHGLRVGLFGLMGESALQVAPNAAPVTIEDPNDAAQAAVDALRAEGVDLVVALSHLGVGEGSIAGEDEGLAADVTGIDVIVSGHSHTLLPSPLDIEGTLIVQAGEYGKHVGRLEIIVDQDGVDREHAISTYRQVPVDDAVQGDSDVEAMVAEAMADVDEILFAPLGLTYDTPIAETAFDVMAEPMEENAMGNLVADAIRHQASQVIEGDPIAFAIVAGGEQRAPLLGGTSGAIWAEDAFEAMSLGTGPDGLPGYPVATFYLTADEIRQGLEVTTSGAPMIGNTVFLQVSGLRFVYDVEGSPFNKVQEIYLGDEEEGYSDVPLDMSEENPALYRVAVSYYLAKMIFEIGAMTYGLLTLAPRDADGNPIPPEAIESTVLDMDPSVAGVQEMKVWRALMDYLQSMEDTDGDGLSDMEERYSSALGRIEGI